jgi:hypothetical protein
MSLPIYLNTEVGYALWWLTHPERGPASGPEIVQRLIARGHVANRAEASAVLAQARRNAAAQVRLSQAAGDVSLRAGCGYKCPPDMPISLRIRVNAIDGEGNIVQSRSIVITARADMKLQAVLDRTREAFDRRYRKGTTHRSGQLQIDQELTSANIDQVLLDYTEGSVWA